MPVPIKVTYHERPEAFNIKSGNVKQDILKTIEELSNIKIIQKKFPIKSH